MNKRNVISHLEEALEEIERTVANLKKKRNYGEPELQVALEHAYHHLNTAWNARGVTDARARECSTRDFRAWQKFPKDLFRD